MVYKVHLPLIICFNCSVRTTVQKTDIAFLSHYLKLFYVAIRPIQETYVEAETDGHQFNDFMNGFKKNDYLFFRLYLYCKCYCIFTVSLLELFLKKSSYKNSCLLASLLGQRVLLRYCFLLLQKLLVLHL